MDTCIHGYMHKVFAESVGCPNSLVGSSSAPKAGYSCALVPNDEKKQMQPLICKTSDSTNSARIFLGFERVMIRIISIRGSSLAQQYCKAKASCRANPTIPPLLDSERSFMLL